jgi:hypothetical protein
MSNKSLKGFRALALAGAMLTAGGAQALDTDLPLGTSYSGTAPGGAAPWVNVRFRDFSGADPGAYGTFEWIRNTVEVQVTTATTAPGAPYDDPGGSCCPVVGKGNLTAKERLLELYLNFNSRLDASKLKVYWTGKPMDAGPAGSNVFPAAGLEPIRIEVRENGFKADGGAGRFDVLLMWNGNAKLGQDADWSKLLFVYDNGNTDISADDFLVVSSGATSPAAPFIAVGRVQNTNGATANGWIKN